MIDHIKTQALVLEDAQKKSEEATKLYEPIAEEVRVLETRIAQERAKSAKAVADFRAGLIDVGVAGIIEKTAALDIVDLEKLLAPVKERAASALAALNKAHDVLRLAAASFQAAERKVTLDTFDRDVIRVLERKLIEAIVERYKMSGEKTGSTWRCYSPSLDLKDVIERQVVPILR
jgi:hypothetical protein